MEYNFVDTDWGTWDDNHKVEWYDAEPNLVKIHDKYSSIMKIVDVNGDGLSGVESVFTQVNGSIVLNTTTNQDGYVNVYNGTITGVGDNYIEDTSQSWSDDELHYLEVYITSGDGVGQRRIIMEDNNETYFEVVPDWETNPSIGDRFIIIPYFDDNIYTQNDLTATGYTWSNYTTLNPYNLTLSKDSYVVYTSILQIDSASKSTIKLTALNESDSELIFVRRGGGLFLI